MQISFRWPESIHSDSKLTQADLAKILEGLWHTVETFCIQDRMDGALDRFFNLFIKQMIEHRLRPEELNALVRQSWLSYGRKGKFGHLYYVPTEDSAVNRRVDAIESRVSSQYEEMGMRYDRKKDFRPLVDTAEYMLTMEPRLEMSEAEKQAYREFLRYTNYFTVFTEG